MGRLLCEGFVSGLAVEKRTRGVISMSHDRHFTLGSAAAYTPQVLTYSLFVSTVLSDHRKGLHRTKLCLTPLGKCAYEAGTKWGARSRHKVGPKDREVLYEREVPEGRRTRTCTSGVVCWDEGALREVGEGLEQGKRNRDDASVGSVHRDTK